MRRTSRSTTTRCRTGGKTTRMALARTSRTRTPCTPERSRSPSYRTAAPRTRFRWPEVTVTLSTLTAANPPWDGSFDRIDIVSHTGGPQPVLYMDEFVLMPPGGLQIEHDVTVASMVSDRFTWMDSNHLPRKASLAH